MHADKPSNLNCAHFLLGRWCERLERSTVLIGFHSGVEPIESLNMHVFFVSIIALLYCFRDGAKISIFPKTFLNLKYEPIRNESQFSVIYCVSK